MAEQKLFDRFYKRKYTKASKPDPGFEQLVNPSELAEYMEKAVRLIRVKQYHSGFPEFFSHELRGDIEVSIQQDVERPDLFDVQFKFVVLPGRMTLFQAQKLINYLELKRLAAEYDKNRDQVNDELERRDDLVRNIF